MKSGFPGRRKRAGVVPTTRLGVLLLVAAPVWLLSGMRWGSALAAMILLAVLAVVGYELVTLAPARRFSISREAPTTTGLGDTATIAYTIVSEWPRSARVRIYESVPPALRTGGDSHVEITATRGATVATASIAPQTRGRHPLGPITARVAGRLGLVERSWRIHLDDTVSVAPSLASAQRFRLRALQARTHDAGVRVLRHRGESLSFAALRPYAPGDDPRRIDWKATARQRAPIVREYSLEQGQTVLIAVDAGRLMTQREGGLARFEYALSAAIVLAAVAADAGDKIGLLLFDDAVRAFLPPVGGTAAVRSIRDALIGAEPRLVEPDYAAAFATLATRQRRRALIVLFSDVIDARSSRSLIAQTARGTTRHLHLVVALRSQALFSSASLPGQPTTDVLYRAAAAEELVLAREEALHRMRQSGVNVVDVPMSGLTATVVDRYLELKGRGAI